MMSGLLKQRSVLVLLLVGGLFAGGMPRLETAAALVQEHIPPDKTTVDITLSSYPIPAGALFVAPGGSDTNAGTEQAPWRTIGHALRSAPTRSTIVIRAGIYREGNINLFGKRLTIQPYPGEKVWLKGTAVVDGWTQEGALWRRTGWTTTFPQSTAVPDAIDPAYSMARYPEMLFYNDIGLVQVASKASVVPGTFFFDYGAGTLYVGNNPAGGIFEATVHAHALNLSDTRGSIVRGIGFTGYAAHINPQTNQCMVRGTTAGMIFENNTFAWSAACGLQVFGSGVIVRGNRFLYNGQVGMAVSRGDFLLAEQNYFAYNNRERFNQLWECGGAKLTNTHYALLRDNVAEYNYCSGLWVDIESSHVTVVRNRSQYNEKHGIHYERSYDGVVASNIAVANQRSGIQIGSGSINVRVYNNTLVRNDRNINVINDARPRSNAGITIKNNILADDDGVDSGSVHEALLNVEDWSGRNPWISADLMVSMLDYNAYYRENAASPPRLISWQQPVSNLSLTTLEQIRSQIGHEHHGISATGAAASFFLDAAAGDFRLKPGSPVVNAGQPLPHDIAAAVGVAAGSVVSMGALRAPDLARESLIQIQAAGMSADTTFPSFELLVDDTVVATFSNVQGDPQQRIFQQFQQQIPRQIYANQVKIRLVNASPLRRLRVDAITIDGVRYETESLLTFSTGSIPAAAGCTMGYAYSEWIVCNGYVQYDPRGLRPAQTIRIPLIQR
ncbi:MAG TPA: right-handed parallel beta-helix repeat-containing protein [Roseiflexaceae bacterium]|nr:right-handed parallel beta-helix repeat-containing protein [Roseiflexaceae bacterium]